MWGEGEGRWILLSMLISDLFPIDICSFSQLTERKSALESIFYKQRTAEKIIFTGFARWNIMFTGFPTASIFSKKNIGFLAIFQKERILTHRK